MIASASDSDSCLEALTKYGPVPVDECDMNGNDLLMTSCLGRKYERARFFLKHHVKIGRFNKMGMSALHIMVRDGHRRDALTQLILDHSTDLDISPDKTGETALMYACKKKRLDCASLLMERGADVNARDNLGNTAMSTACKDQNTPLVDLLLAHSPDLSIPDNEGNTCLMIALKQVKSNFEGNPYSLSTVMNLVTKGAVLNGRPCDQNMPSTVPTNVRQKVIREMNWFRRKGFVLFLYHCGYFTTAAAKSSGCEEQILFSGLTSYVPASTVFCCYDLVRLICLYT